MKRVGIDSFEIKFKSALHNLIFAILIGAMLFALSVPAQAQPPMKVPRIGYLEPGTASGNTVLLDGFRQELSKLGWVEGKNVTIQYKFCRAKE
jgi:hypothetical protein